MATLIVAGPLTVMLAVRPALTSMAPNWKCWLNMLLVAEICPKINGRGDRI